MAGSVAVAVARGVGDIRPVVILAATGAALWFLAALFIHWTIPLGAFRPPWVALTYALSALLAWPAPWVRRLVGWPRDRALEAVTIATVAALLLDGVAFVAFRGLYAADDASALGGAAWLLWGVGLIFIAGLVDGRRRA